MDDMTRRTMLTLSASGLVTAGWIDAGLRSAKAALEYVLPESSKPIVTPEDKKKLDSTDFSWLTQEHVEDMLGALYFGRGELSRRDKLNDGWKRAGNVSTLENAPWGGKCTVIYETHRIKTAEPPDLDIDVLTQEDMTFTGKESPNDTFVIRAERIDLVKKYPQVPTYNVDVGVDVDRRMKIILSLFATEFAIGQLGLKALEGLGSAPNIGKAALGAYGLSNLLAGLLVIYDFRKGQGFDRSAVMRKIMDETPTLMGLVIFNIRNTLAAEKDFYIATLLGESLGKDVHLGTCWAYGHTGIETETLKSSKERLAFLARWKPLILLLCEDTASQRHLWTAKRLGYREAHGQLGSYEIDELEVPQLKRLFQR